MIAAAPTPAGTRYTLLRIGQTRLLLAQSDIRDIGMAGDINPASAPSGGVGWMSFNRRSWPVYCLSDELDFINDVPDTRRACVLLMQGEMLFGLLCDQVDVLGSAPTFYPLPDCMKLADSPVAALAVLPDGIACLSTAQRLAVRQPDTTRLTQECVA